MRWPHEEGFPGRAGVVVAACVASALVAAMLPGLPIAERFMGIVMVPFVLACTYALFRFFLRVVGSFARPAAVAYAYFLFYASLVCTAMVVVLFPVVVLDPELAPWERVYVASGSVPAGLGACAAAVSMFKR
jgi:hypothetical protein